ncbi:DUF6884 domain-containing protein [Kitasatospora griseola]|uniref:DUF6884 domain-containing protein n=1 Tax=Kitasatospora griseola TaxID=2064 RepID=UPI003423852B
MPDPTDPVATAARGIKQAIDDWDAVNDSYVDDNGTVVDTRGYETGIVERDLAAWKHFSTVLEHGAPFLLLTKDTPRVKHAHTTLVETLSTAYSTLHKMIDSPQTGDHPLREEAAAEIWHEMSSWAEHAPTVIDAHRSAEADHTAVAPPRPTRPDRSRPVRAAVEQLPTTAHDAVLAAASQPDHLFEKRPHPRTLDLLTDRGMAWVRPLPDGHQVTRDHQFALAVHLTEAGRQYALRHGAHAPRRRAVIISCGSRKATPAPDATTVPAGDLYTGTYHQALRRTAEALTGDWGTVYILSAQAGLVRTDCLLTPYNLRITDATAVTGEQLRTDAASFDLDHADVIFLGGAKYAQALRPAVPHFALPLAGTRGIGEQLQLLAALREPETGQDRRTACWAQAEHQRAGETERTPPTAGCATPTAPSTPNRRSR